MLRAQQDRMVDPDGTVRLKRVFYTLRPALALRWMRLHDGAMPPMDMTTLMAACDLTNSETQAIYDLIEQKKKLTEATGSGGVSAQLVDLVNDEVDAARMYLDQNQTRKSGPVCHDQASALNLKYARLAGA